MTATTQAHVPGTGIRCIAVQDSARVSFWPAEDAHWPEPLILLDSRMGTGFVPAGDAVTMRWTVPAWQAFIAAVKAGEFDNLLSE